MDRQRIDKWLWHARAVRTRTAAATLVESGHVRLNGARTSAASQPVRVGDALTIALDRSVRVLKVCGFAERRGSAVEASVLFEEIREAEPQPAAQRLPSLAVREAGAGRPTKRDRRSIDRLTGDDH